LNQEPGHAKGGFNRVTKKKKTLFWGGKQPKKKGTFFLEEPSPRLGTRLRKKRALGKRSGTGERVQSKKSHTKGGKVKI